ncbi:MAG: DUF1192 family protein, partial [Geminicoccaceae bacterium]|nr:DUF1192 family protein [Geminicoccaceae bacterium]
MKLLPGHRKVPHRPLGHRDLAPFTPTAKSQAGVGLVKAAPIRLDRFSTANLVVSAPEGCPLDEDELRPPAAAGLPRPLEALSIADLEAYGEALEREIARVREELARRRA